MNSFWFLIQIVPGWSAALPSVHDAADLNRMSVVSVRNLDSVARVTCMNDKPVSNIHRHMVNTASVAVEEQIARLR